VRVAPTLRKVAAKKQELGGRENTGGLVFRVEDSGGDLRRHVIGT